jgi:hypothetical protein
MAVADLNAAKYEIFEYFNSVEEYEKVAEWLEELDADLAILVRRLQRNPQAYQRYIPIENAKLSYEYRKAQLLHGWYLVFWWVDEDNRECHIQRVLNAKSNYEREMR